MWRKARKKPVEVEFREVEPISDFSWSYGRKIGDIFGETVSTLEGSMMAVTGRDYIIRGVKGELYPIKKDIFNETYDILYSSLEVCPTCRKELNIPKSRIALNDFIRCKRCGELFGR